jgi:hypothetical protein
MARGAVVQRNKSGYATIVPVFYALAHPGVN